MARLFVRLKWSLLVGRLKGGWQAKLGVILGLVLVLPAGVLIGIGLAYAGRQLQSGPDIAVLVMGVTTLLWTVGPAIFFGVDDTLDPGRLTPLPLTRRQLLIGMSAASTIGIGPTLTLLIALGVLVGLAPASPLVVVTVLALVLHLLVCVFAGRLVATALANALRSRRGKDATGVIVGLLAVTLPQIPNLLINVVDVDIDNVGSTVERIATGVGLTPFGLTGRTVAAAARGEVAVALGSLALATGLLALLGWGWVHALARLSTTVPGRGDAGAGRDLFPAWLGGLPRNRFGAATAKELRYFARDPRHRVALSINMVFCLGICVATALLIDGPRSVLLTAGTGVLFGFGALNLFGVDGQATSLLMLAPGDHRADVAGKNAALGILALPILGLIPIAVAVVNGGWVYVPVAWTTAIGLLLVFQGVGNISSVFAAFPMPEGGNAFGQQSGGNVAAGFGALLAMLLGGLLAIPIIVPTALAAFFATGWLTLTAVLSPAYGALIWFLGTKRGARDLGAQGPELLVRLTPP